MSQTMTGGCQCGRIRYTVKAEPTSAYLCHCRMCQRATGGFAASLVSVKYADVQWSHAPEWYQSSPIARRPFCSHCGTPLGFRFVEGSENMDLTVGSFDDPSSFVPQQHFGTEGLHEAWIDTSALPRMRTDENAGILQKWQDAGAEPPR